MKITVTPCKRCNAPMLPAEVLDKSPHLAAQYRRPAPNGYICQPCQHDRPGVSVPREGRGLDG